MSDLDLDRLGDVWRQRPSPAELEELKRAAEAVAHRARWGQRLDLISAVLVAGVVLILILANPTADTLLVGGAAILILLVSQIRSRRLRQEELRSLTGTTEQMLDQSVARIEATMKRTRLQLALLVPGFAFGLLVAKLVDNRNGFFERLLPDAGIATLVAGGGIAVMALTAFLLSRWMRQTRQERDRLIALRDAYRQEREHSQEG